MKLPSYPTTDMIDAGYRRAKVEPEMDKMAINNIFLDMIEASPSFPGVTTREFQRFLDCLDNLDYSENRRWLAAQGPHVMQAVMVMLVAYAAGYAGHGITPLAIRAEEIAKEFDK